MRASVLPVVCERVRGHVSVLLDGELSELEQRMAVAHLDRCAECSAFEADVRRITMELRSTPAESPSRPIVVRRTRRVSYGAVQVSAAAAMLVFGVLGLASQLYVTEPGAHNASSQRAGSPNLFRTSWQPELELAQIEPVESVQEPENRPRPTPAL
jgi:anti-sigma factor RsiW